MGVLEHMVRIIQANTMDLENKQDIKNKRKNIFFHWFLHDGVSKSEIASSFIPGSLSSIPIILLDATHMPKNLSTLASKETNE